MYLTVCPHATVGVPAVPQDRLHLLRVQGRAQGPAAGVRLLLEPGRRRQGPHVSRRRRGPCVRVCARWCACACAWFVRASVLGPGRRRAAREYDCIVVHVKPIALEVGSVWGKAM